MTLVMEIVYNQSQSQHINKFTIWSKHNNNKKHLLKQKLLFILIYVYSLLC